MPTTTDHIHADQLEWTSNPTYPPEIRMVYRYKELIGSSQPIEPHTPDARMGILELDPGAFYPFHAHPSPEIYYVIEGIAEWTVNDHTFVAPAGTAIRHQPFDCHAMRNIGATPLKLIYFWWAPDGETEVLDVRAKLIEPSPN